MRMHLLLVHHVDSCSLIFFLLLLSLWARGSKLKVISNLHQPTIVFIVRLTYVKAGVLQGAALKL
jgi:hypothetical protein